MRGHARVALIALGLYGLTGCVVSAAWPFHPYDKSAWPTALQTIYAPLFAAGEHIDSWGGDAARIFLVASVAALVAGVLLLAGRGRI